MAVRRTGMAVLGALLIASSLALPAAAAEALTPEQKQAVEAIVQDYIRNHPEISDGAICKLTGEDALLQGHALWHILAGVSTGAFYLHFLRD